MARLHLSINLCLEDDSNEATKDETTSEGTEFTYSDDFEVGFSYPFNFNLNFLLKLKSKFYMIIL